MISGGIWLHVIETQKMLQKIIVLSEKVMATFGQLTLHYSPPLLDVALFQTFPLFCHICFTNVYPPVLFKTNHYRSIILCRVGSDFFYFVQLISQHFMNYIADGVFSFFNKIGKCFSDFIPI
jgi:hypothetical protein